MTNSVISRSARRKNHARLHGTTESLRIRGKDSVGPWESTTRAPPNHDDAGHWLDGDLLARCLIDHDNIRERSPRVDGDS